MNRKQLENLCEVNGIIHFQLKNKEDLLKVFGIKVDQLEGFENLSDEHKKLFTNFLINFYNAHGVDSKLCLEPVGIHFVEENELIVKENKVDNNTDDDKDDFWQWFETKVYILNKDSDQIELFKHHKESKIQHLACTDAIFKKYRKKYLRFDYKWNLTDEIVNEWLHVTDENNWY